MVRKVNDTTNSFAKSELGRWPVAVPPSDTISLDLHSQKSPSPGA